MDVTIQEASFQEVIFLSVLFSLFIPPSPRKIGSEYLSNQSKRTQPRYMIRASGPLSQLSERKYSSLFTKGWLDYVRLPL